MVFNHFASVLLSAHAERFSVSRMHDLFSYCCCLGACVPVSQVNLEAEYTDVCHLTEEEASSISAVLVVQVVLDRRLAIWILFCNYLENTYEGIPLGLCILHDKSPRK